MTVPAQPKLYHILHLDRLASIIADGHLWCDAEIVRRAPPGTTIGMTGIKQRRLQELRLTSHPILHLQADLYAAVAWAAQMGRRWAFTLSNAGSRFFEDRCNLAQLGELDWAAIQTHSWQQCKEGKQAEFLLEAAFPWHLVERIGVKSAATYQQAVNLLPANGHRPPVEVKADWYY